MRCFQPEDEPQEEGVNYDDPEVQLAATKIQAGFKGMHARKQVGEMKAAKQAEDDQPLGEMVHEEPMDSQKCMAQEEPVVAQEESEEQNAPEETTEQNDEVKDEEVKDEEVKDEVKAEADAEDELTEVTPTGADAPNEEIDIDLTDPEVAKAAEKIQAGFKGYKTRKELGAAKEGEQQDEAPPGDDEGEPQEDSSPQEGAADTQQEGGEKTTE